MKESRRVSFRLNLILINLVDAILLNLAVVAALALRFDGAIPGRFLHSFALSLPVYTMGMLLLLNAAGINRSLWRYAGVPTLLILVRTLSIGFVVAFVLNLIPRVHLFPTSVVILSWILATSLILASRLAWKMFRHQATGGARRSGKRILIVGAGDVGAMLARELQRGEVHAGHAVGFVDDDPNKRGRRVETLAVLGTTFDIPQLIAERSIAEVLIAAPSAPSRLIREVVQICQNAGVECRTVPALSDYITGKGALGQLRDVQIEDLLGREPVSIDLEGIAERIGGRTVLVTGAGGSIGSELCRQLARFHPGTLVAVDHCENRLCYLGLDLNEAHPELKLVQAVGDIRDEIGMRNLFRTHRPEIVFHAAAHKHVHFLERAPREAILNNILGTRNLARAAVACEVETFVFISTDKAVNPSNVMGASKRACELLLQSMAGEGATTFVAVRFGNVLGSDGSVIPIFRRQLAKGGPITVTHPEVRRYFMTIPEASQLVIQAALFGTSGDVFVLDMGEQVRILDVAEQLVRLSGLRPGIDVPIRFVGLRPGEKLEEELLTHSERTRVTEHRKIFRLVLDPVEPESVRRQIDHLAVLADGSAGDEIREALADLVTEYRVQEVAPLPPAVEVDAVLPAPPPVRRLVPVRHRDRRARRAVDVLIAGPLLAALLPLAGVMLLAYCALGPGRVRLRRRERVGTDLRSGNRRLQSGRVPIDRRYSDRRKRMLSGRPFLACTIEFPRPAASGAQRALADFLRRRGLDRAPLLWNVLRGDMSLVGPGVRLPGEIAPLDEWTAEWLFARRPGLTGPARCFLDPAELSGRRATLYDCYYARYGGWRMDVEVLWRSLGRLVRGEEPGEEILGDERLLAVGGSSAGRIEEGGLG